MDHLYPITLPSNLKKCNRKLFKSLDGSQISKKLWGGSFFFFQKLIFLVINCSSKSFMTLSTAQILVLDKVINLKYYKYWQETPPYIFAHYSRNVWYCPDRQYKPPTPKKKEKMAKDVYISFFIVLGIYNFNWRKRKRRNVLYYQQQNKLETQ